LLVFAVAALAVAAIACDDDDDEPEASGGGNTPAAGETPSGNGDGGGGGRILEQVRSRGELICGVNDAVPGFGFVDAQGAFSGFDVDYCKAVAAAVLGDANAVQYVPLTAEARLTALSTGQVDVLIRNTTWTVSRDAQSGLAFATTTFYDGQGIMVREADGFATVDDLANATVCVLQGTTTELNLADRLPTSTPLPFEDNETLQAAFVEERCDAWTSDKSQLAARRSAYPADAGGPESLVILEETFSKEPLGPLTVDNDSQWFDVVNWTVIGTILAEEFGITSENVESAAGSPESIDVARLLGVPFEGEAAFDPGLGIDADFMQGVIAAVGNYGEIYERNITPIGIEREGTLNAQWTDGGLIYGPPFR
jgi:general L-amino acid transport system substrate-binding protein